MYEELEETLKIKHIEESPYNEPLQIGSKQFGLITNDQFQDYENGQCSNIMHDIFGIHQTYAEISYGWYGDEITIEFEYLQWELSDIKDPEAWLKNNQYILHFKGNDDTSIFYLFDSIHNMMNFYKSYLVKDGISGLCSREYYKMN